MHRIPRLAALVACLGLMFGQAAPAAAHFLWLKTIRLDDRPHAFLFFGENALDEAYHLPESLADSKVWRPTPNGKRTELPLEPLESDDRIGLTAPLPQETPCILEASEQYGVYGTALLVYSAKHVHAGSSDEFNAAGASKELALDIVPRVELKQVQLTVLWQGKPLADAELSIAVGDAEPTTEKSDQNGRLTFTPKDEGLVSVLANRTDKELMGKLNDKPYDHGLHYASLTFDWPISATPSVDETSSTNPRPELPPLPEPLSSFGAVVADGSLYIYGGHTGTEHEHSAANLSNHFRRIQIDGTDTASGRPEWEELPMQTPLQGLALVTHNGRIYRMGGMNARNATPADKADVHSSAEFAQFDPSTGQWTALAPLPAPRSSHNAVVIGDRLYIVGGWTLSGKSKGSWQADALLYDFTNSEAGWQTLPKPPFKRRALAVSHWNGRLVAIGGLDEAGEVSQRVDVLDTEKGEWSEGPELPGAGLAGFGGSAWNLNGRLFVSGLRGIVYRLNDVGSAWEEVACKARGRFFHQLVPGPGGGLLAIGGASRTGHLADIEWIDVGN
jgi:Kelch motif